MMRAMATSKRTLYEIVGAAPDAAPEDIARACDARREALQARGSADSSAMALIRQAREVLLDPKRRADYDAALAARAAGSPSGDADAGDELVEGEVEEVVPAHRAPPWGLIAVGAAAVLIVALFVARMMTNPVPPAAVPVAEAPKAAPPAPPPVLTPARLIARVSPSIARLQTVDLAGNVLPLGMAVVTEAGLAVTTCHAIPANAQIVATFGSEKGAGMLVITDEVLDLCKLSIAGTSPPPLALSGEELKAGDKVYVVSPDSPGSYALVDASVKQLARGPQGETFQVSSKAANGAPVIDEHGHLLGIASGDSVIAASNIAQARSRTR